MTTKYKDTEFGEIVGFPHVNSPDTKFAKVEGDGEYKLDLAIGGEEGAARYEEVKAASQKAFDDWMADEKGGAKLPKPKRNEFEVFCPAHPELDDETAEPTGRYIFQFRQNSRIKLKDNQGFKDIVLGLYDASAEPTTKPIWSGSVVRVNYTMRPIPMPGLKKVGVRLDFGRVQVRKFKTSSGGGGGFSKVDGDVAGPEDQAEQADY
jgi:hypothetical protein